MMLIVFFILIYHIIVNTLYANDQYHLLNLGKILFCPMEGFFLFF